MTATQLPAERIKHEANELFVREGAKETLSIIPRKGSYLCDLVSTSGTHYFYGSLDQCRERESELLTYAMHG